jgi:hypothetical protein
MDELIFPKVYAYMGKVLTIGVEEQKIARPALLHGDRRKDVRHVVGAPGEMDAMAAIDMLNEPAAIKTLSR